MKGVGLHYPKGVEFIEHEDGCAYAYGNATYPCWCFVYRRDAEEAAAAERARILAALPAALRAVQVDAWNLDLEHFAAALVAAIEAQLSRESGEEG